MTVRSNRGWSPLLGLVVAVGIAGCQAAGPGPAGGLSGPSVRSVPSGSGAGEGDGSAIAGATAGPGSSASQGGADGSGAAIPAPQGTAAAVTEALRPARVALPSIQVDAPVGDLGIGGDHHVQVPAHPQDTGWLTTSPAPGQQGPAVILGHVDSTSGPAVFYGLRRLAVGDPVVVTRRDGSQVRFTVDGVRRFAKSDFPTQATYGPVPGPALRLITCDGPYDRSAGGYQDNLVVFAS